MSVEKRYDVYDCLRGCTPHDGAWLPPKVQGGEVGELGSGVDGGTGDAGEFLGY